MALEIRPGWDRSETVSVRLCEQRRELELSGGGELVRYRLREQSPSRLGWVERRLERGLERRRRVAVGEVVLACLREWEAEQRVIALSRQAASRAHWRGGRWRAAGERLDGQARKAGRRERVSTLPFRVLFLHLSDDGRERPLTRSLAAERVGWSAGGRPDTSRLLRRFGLADDSDRGGRRRQRSVGYRTGVALCRAIDLDPVELGL